MERERFVSREKSVISQMSSTDSPGRHVWSNAEELLLDKALTRHLSTNTTLFAAKPTGHILKEEDLWTCGQRGAKLAVMRKIEEQFQHFGEEAEKQAANIFTCQQLQYKIKNMLVNGHWKLENGLVKRTDEQREGKRNQKMAFANFSERSAQAVRDRAELPYEQVAAKEQQHGRGPNRLHR